MRTDRLTRAPRTASPDLSPPPPPVPVERQVVEVPTKEIHEKCTRCGVFVRFRVYASREDLDYVRCPHCGAKHARSRTLDTIRAVR